MRRTCNLRFHAFLSWADEFEASFSAMALTARPLTSVMTPSSSASTRIPAGARGVASLDSAPVEAMSQWVGVSNGEADQLFQEYGQYPSGRRGREPEPDAYKRPLQPTQSFTNLIEQFSESQPKHRAALVLGSAAVTAVLGQAISAYEKTAGVIAGTHEGIVGGVFSIRL